MKNPNKASRCMLALLLSGLALPPATEVMARDSTSYTPAAMQVLSSIPIGTVATWPIDRAVPPGWMPCDGQPVSTAYPRLRALMSAVPNYNNNQFLRGSKSNIGQSYEDSTRYHTHGQPSHSHGFALSLGSTEITGTAEGQKYFDMKSGYMPTKGGPSVYGSEGFKQHVRDIFGELDGIDQLIYLDTKVKVSESKATGTISGNTGYAGAHSHGVTVSGGEAGTLYGGTDSSGSHNHNVNLSANLNVAAPDAKVEQTIGKWIVDGGESVASTSAISGSLVNGSISGEIYQSGGDQTYENEDNRGNQGGSETAPMHTKVKFIIKHD